MDAPSRTSGTLALLASLFRERRSGVLTLGPGDATLRVLLRNGQVVGLGSVEMPGPLPRPDGRYPVPRRAVVMMRQAAWATFSLTQSTISSVRVPGVKTWATPIS